MTQVPAHPSATRWWPLGRRIAALIGAGASIIGLLFAVGVAEAPRLMLATLVGAVMSLGIVIEIRDSRRSAPQLFDEQGIRDFLFAWIGQSGQTAIFSRDMTWVKDDDMRSLLLSKAQRGELTIVLPRSIPLSDELGSRGAEIILYPELDYVIRSRFTMVNLERADTRVAIGTTVDGGLVSVEKIAVGEHPSFFLALDIVELLRRYGRQRIDGS